VLEKFRKRVKEQSRKHAKRKNHASVWAREKAKKETDVMGQRAKRRKNGQVLTKRATKRESRKKPLLVSKEGRGEKGRIKEGLGGDSKGI